MATYFDTSVLIPLFFNEAGTTAARAEVANESTIWVSHWTLAEFSSATAFKLRAGQIDAKTASTVRSLFAELLNSRLTVVDVLREDFVTAGRLCEITPAPGLRTPDALHLAIVLRLGLRMVSFDDALVGACQLHGAAWGSRGAAAS
jgi:predicted nucleic acid-binding protein